MPKSRFYKLLGLPPTASEKEVRRKYRQLAMKYHPDRNSDPKASEMFIALTEAYEIILSKEPYGTTTQRAYTEEEIKQQREQRMQTARKRYADQVEKERLENERYYQFLISGKKWKTIRVTAFLGVLFSLMMIADRFLPHHYEEDQITHFQRNIGHSIDGQLLGLVKTEKSNYYLISRMRYSLFGKNRHIYTETSWFFHNPIQLISRGKTSYEYFNIHFTLYKSIWLLVPIFLIPTLTLFYKRKKISFTFLFHMSYYGVSIVMLLYLLTGNRWAHFLTLGFA